MNKILFVATIDQHIRHFHYPFLKWFKDHGYEVHVASNGTEKLQYVDKKIDVQFTRSPYDKKNIIAYKQLKKIISDNDYRLIHCHTPVGGIIGRLASKEARKKGTKVLYTAHGFHFYKGAPLLNWLLYFSVEKILSRYTDTLITINEEDFNNAKKGEFSAKKIRLINGVGIDIAKFDVSSELDRQQLRKFVELDKDDFVLIYVAELSKRKNQEFLIKSMPSLQKKIPNIKLLLVGKDNVQGRYEKLINKLELTDAIKLLGYRTDVAQLMNLSDVAVSSSNQEGLPVNIMEAMASGLPVVASDCRGNRDLVKTGINGLLFEIDNYDQYHNAIIKVYNDKKIRQEYGQKGLLFIEQFKIEKIKSDMEKIYIESLTSNS